MKSLKSLLMKLPYGKFPFDRFGLVITIIAFLAIIPTVYGVSVRTVFKSRAAAPTNFDLTFTVASCTSVKFSWTTSSGADRYVPFLWNPSTGWQQGPDISALRNLREWTWTGVSENSRYGGQVQSFNSSGTGYSNVQYLNTPACSTTPSCTNDCSSSGARQCVSSNSTQYRICGSVGSCLKWTTYSCPSGQTCSDSGVCSTTPTPTPTTKPDLDPQPITGVSSTTTGTSQTFSTVVKNTGNATASGTFINRWYVDDNFYLSQNLSNLAAGASSANLSFTYSFPTTGTHIVKFCADDTNLIAESNAAGTAEKNNCETKSVSVIASTTKGNINFRVRLVNSSGQPTGSFIDGATAVLAKTDGSLFNPSITTTSVNGGWVYFNSIPTDTYGIYAYKEGYIGKSKQTVGSTPNCTDSNFVVGATRAYGIYTAAWDNNVEVKAGTTYCHDLGLMQVVTPACTAPSGPTLTGPAERATFELPVNFNFTWTAPTNKGSGIIAYWVQVADNSNFSNPQQYSAGTATSLSSTKFTLSPDKTYYWRVYAQTCQSPDVRTYSSYRSFITNPIKPAETCDNSFPQNSWRVCYYNLNQYVDPVDKAGYLGSQSGIASISIDTGGAIYNNNQSDFIYGVWRGNFDFAEGDWKFKVDTDDGVRLKVDGTTFIDKWQRQVASYDVTQKLSGGRHNVEVEWFEYDGWAKLVLSWEFIPPPPSDCSEHSLDCFKNHIRKTVGDQVISVPNYGAARFDTFLWGLAGCESTWVETVVDPGGSFHGLYQYLISTWNSSNAVRGVSPAPYIYDGFAQIDNTAWIIITPWATISSQWPGCTNGSGREWTNFLYNW